MSTFTGNRLTTTKNNRIRIWIGILLIALGIAGLLFSNQQEPLIYFFFLVSSINLIGGILMILYSIPSIQSDDMEEVRLKTVILSIFFLAMIWGIYYFVLSLKGTYTLELDSIGIAKANFDTISIIQGMLYLAYAAGLRILRIELYPDFPEEVYKDCNQC